MARLQREDPSKQLKKKDVAPHLSNALKKITRESIKNGFRKTGLYPLNVEAIDFTKFLDVDITEFNELDQTQSSDNNSNETITINDYKTALKVIEFEVGQEKIKRNTQSRSNMSSDLYDVYREIRFKANQIISNSNPKNNSSVNVSNINDENDNLIDFNDSNITDPSSSRVNHIASSERKQQLG